jgi:hypothetical protein
MTTGSWIGFSSTMIHDFDRWTADDDHSPITELYQNKYPTFQPQDGLLTT